MNTNEIPTKYQGIYRRAMQGRNRKDAVRAHCLMCVNWQYVEVKLCPARNCPLWRYRLGAKLHENLSDPPKSGA